MGRGWPDGASRKGPHSCRRGARGCWRLSPPGCQLWAAVSPGGKGPPGQLGRPRGDRDFPGLVAPGATGARLGPNASGELLRRISKLDSSPPGSRKAGLREVSEVLRRSGQVGCPPIVSTDAQLGFSVAAYQSADLLFD